MTRPSPPCGVIFVVRMNDSEQAYTAALAAIRAGVDAVELTMSVPNAFQVIERLATEDVSLGAGTVLTAKQAIDSVAAGALFIVSPNTNPSVMDAAHDRGVPIVPGALTPTEIQSAWELGADAVKVFPIGSVGGVQYLEELTGPLSHIPYVISGGADPVSAAQYFRAGAIAVCLGRHLVTADDVALVGFDTLVARTRDVLATIRG